MGLSMRWVAGGVVIALGAIWLACLAWNRSELAAPYAPVGIGALVGALTLAAAADRRSYALSVIATLGAMGLLLALGSRIVLWDTRALTGLETALIVATALVGALAGTAARARSRRGGGWLWLWVSALISVGTLGLAGALSSRMGPAALIPAAAGGALCQILAPHRMIWTCAAGSTLLLVFGVQESWRRFDPGILVMMLLGVAVFVLLNALTAVIAWRAFRNHEPRTPRAVPALPAAHVER